MCQNIWKYMKGIIDIEYDEWIDVDESTSLQTLCAKKLLSDVCLIEHNIEYLPIVLKKKLMEIALIEGRYPSIGLLMKFWPFEVFHIPMPSELKGWHMLRLQTNGQYWQTLKGLFPTVLMVINNFFELIKSHSLKGNLRTLDLSDVPVCDIGYKKICKEIGESGYRGKNGDIKYTIKIYCCPMNSSAIHQLCKILDVEKLGPCDIQLVVTGLNICNAISGKEAVLLLEVLNPRELQRLSLAHTNFDIKILEEIFQRIKPFHNLKSLSLSYCISYSSLINEKFSTALSDLLQELVHISHLNLSACRISNYLGHILRNTTPREIGVAEENTTIPSCKKLKTSCLHPYCSQKSYGFLQYLNLSYCILCNEDLLNLANSCHVNNLKHLVIASQDFKFSFESLSALLIAVASTLYVIEIADLYLERDQIGSFFSLISNMKNLQFLNIVGVSHDREEEIKHLPLLQKLQHLKCFVTSSTDAFNSRIESIIRSFDRKIDVMYD